jgi:hypothetical protein
MGITDRVKKMTSQVGAEASKAGRLAQAQLKLTSLKSDVGTAEKELGQAAFEVYERGELQAPALEVQFARLREARDAVAAKEAEIAEIKTESDDDASAADAGAAGTTEAPQAAADQETT